jgi:uncharacterized metal-binding protein
VNLIQNCFLGTYVADNSLKKEIDLIYAVPLFQRRVAPRCTIADTILFIRVNRHHIISRRHMPLKGISWTELIKVLDDNKVDTLICGGIKWEERQLSRECGIEIIENVVSTDEEIVKAIKDKTLSPGFGFQTTPQHRNEVIAENDTTGDSWHFKERDCFNCTEQQCLEGRICDLVSGLNSLSDSKETEQILESSRDISLEEERTLCRISEVVYFALEMHYQRIGVAYCIDLAEPAQIVTQVMRRFFQVFPICCKIGGNILTDPMLLGTKKIACNPRGQADVLNKIGVDFNIIIGLCIGADCIFSDISNAPVTTLFVKDRSLANNPIGAVYSEYYLKEVTNSPLK